MILKKEKIITIFFVLFLSITGWAQDMVLINELLIDTAFVEKLPIPVAAISVNAEMTEEIIEEVEEELNISPEELDRVDSVMQILDGELTKYQELITEEYLSSSNIVLLDKTISALTQIQDRAKGYNDIVHNRIAVIEKDNKKISDLKIIWDSTYKSEGISELSPTIKSRLSELVKSLTSTGKNLNNSLNVLLEVQLQLTDYRNDIGKLVTQLKDAYDLTGKNLLIPDSDPLWVLLTQKRDTIGFEKRIEAGLLERKAQAKSYYDYYKVNIYIAIFIIFLTQIVFFLIRHQLLKEQIEDPEQKDNAVLRAFRKPFYPAFLLGLYFAALILPDRPFAIDEIIYLAALIPFTVLLINLLLTKNKFLVIYLAVILAMTVFSDVGFDLEVFSRVVMLIINILALIWLIIILRQEWVGLQDRPFLRKIVRILAKTSLVLLVICLIGNIIGSYTLTKVLLYGVLSTIFLGISMFLLYLIIIGLFTAVFNSKWGQGYRIIRSHKKSILARINRILIFIISVAFFAGVLNGFGILDSIIDSITEVLVTPYKIGSFTFNINDIVIFFIVILITSWISNFVKFILQEQVLFKSRKQKDTSASISSLVRFVIVSIGFFIAALASGFPLDKITLLVSAFGVGIGFGLQNIFNNLVSGIIMVFEKPLQVGDTIEFGSLMGVVKSIGIRASTIRTFDGSEVIVPNGNLISNELINWTHSDMQRRLIIKVGLQYGTDPKKIIEILLKVAKKNKDLMESPEPYVLFKDFGDSALGFELRAWTDSDDWIFIKSDLHVQVNDALKEAGMVIPFPQRDLHIQSIDKDVITTVKRSASQKK